MDNKAATDALLQQVMADHPSMLQGCVGELAQSEVMTIRSNEAKEFMKSHASNFTLLDSLDYASTGDLNTAGFTLTQTWLQKFGDKLNFVFGGADPAAMPAAEAISQAGDVHGDKTFVLGMDGGSASWHYIRGNTPLKYAYSQPFEFFTHKTFEIIDQIQVQGLNPGDANCLITKAGDTVTAEGIVTTVRNAPKIGDTISSVFNYYGGDANDKSAWYNWAEGPGLYIVQDSK